MRKIAAIVVLILFPVMIPFVILGDCLMRALEAFYDTLIKEVSETGTLFKRILKVASK